MSKTIVNLTEHHILQEIERVVEDYPQHPYQQAFSHPDFRQQLLVWVLNRVPSVFTLVEDTQEVSVHPTYAPYCSDPQSCTEFVIRQGIEEILVQNQQEIEHCLPEEEDAGLAPSHWFG
ncbi:hypothetical protein [Leptolyngbya sp. FACHB-17]|uniref:hypothetical protein n=1 Tax=unclassified Leptolyngbya TaxID=2650499 RepID=UPI0016802360|nr:hypothetical protein [Leptolyngbya sp. FACHB-17]MBD2081564.1 hypothetical protein [Leptolyngbya sp. FACHB-17]